MGIPNATKQAASNAVAALGRHISLHTTSGGAGTTGANEASGGGYARQQTTWTAGSTGVNTGAAVTIPCGAATYTEGGIFSAATAGTFVGSGAFASSIVISGSGASIVVTPTINA